MLAGRVSGTRNVVYLEKQLLQLVSARVSESGRQQVKMKCQKYKDFVKVDMKKLTLTGNKPATMVNTSIIAMSVNFNANVSMISAYLATRCREMIRIICFNPIIDACELHKDRHMLVFPPLKLLHIR